MWSGCYIFSFGPVYVNNETALIHWKETSTIKDLTLSTPVYLFNFIIFPIGISSQYIWSISTKVKVQDKGFNKLMK